MSHSPASAVRVRVVVIRVVSILHWIHAELRLIGIQESSSLNWGWLIRVNTWANCISGLWGFVEAIDDGR